MQKILIATENRGKAEEIREIFKDTLYELSFLFDYV
jgi:inosine/xanthosine triphosphate pyrophosphatase family protein